MALPKMLEWPSVVGFLIYMDGFLLPKTLFTCTYKLVINVNDIVGSWCTGLEGVTISIPDWIHFKKLMGSKFKKKCELLSKVQPTGNQLGVKISMHYCFFSLWWSFDNQLWFLCCHLQKHMQRLDSPPEGSHIFCIQVTKSWYWQQQKVINLASKT